MCACQSRLNDCAARRLPVREGLREEPRAQQPAASRLKMFGMEANPGSEPARLSSIQLRACICGSLRLIIITSEAGHERRRLCVHGAGKDRAWCPVPAE